MTDKPLHVRVAEALWWTDPHHEGVPTSTRWVARAPDSEKDCPCRGAHCYPVVPRYDTDWSATGPIIERFGFCTWKTEHGWCARPPEWDGSCGDGQTLLAAVCHLILALSAAGKLRSQEPEAKPCFGCGASYVGSHACTNVERIAYARGLRDAAESIQATIKSCLDAQEPEVVRAYRALAGQKEAEG